MITKIEEINKMINKCSTSGEISAKDISDGNHTFREMYKSREIYISIILNLFPSISWKSKKHYDEENDPMFNGCFITGINTPKGPATFHMKLECWDLFNIPEIERAPEYDFYNTEEVNIRILSLVNTNNK